MFSRISSWPARIDRWLAISIRRRLLEKHLADLDFRFTGKILEIGAGRMGRRGNFEPTFATGATLMQVDIRKSNLPHVQADIEGLPFCEKVFDAVICLEVIEYLKHPDKGFGELSRVMKDNSWLIVSAPFMHRQDAENDYWRFSAAALKLLFSRNDFVGVKIIQQGAAFSVIANIIKYRVHNVRHPGLRSWIGLLIYPAIFFLEWLDRNQGKQKPLMTTFTTGYLTIAQKGLLH